MADIKVSIIVPVYNVETYLRKCLDSIINQTLKEIEIICINDGSTDNSLDILHEYAKRDSRIIIINQENKKQGTARNRGLDIARGEFITFVDSDDWIDNDYLELLYNAAIKHNVNIAAASATRNYKHKVKNHLKLSEEKVYFGANEIVKGLDKHLETHSKLYRFELIKEIRFPEYVLYEDAPYTLEAILSEQSMVTVPNAHYHYFSNPKSTIKQKLGIKNENDKIEMNLLLNKIAKENNIDICERFVFKERHALWSIKHYEDYKDYYICGIKVARRSIKFDNSKVFVVFNTACFGDVLLCNSLCQNIKNIFPESKVVFVTDKNFEVVAKHQEGVDEVVVYDKKGKHKGLFGLLKFVREFKYKKIFASFITYKNERNYLIAKLLGSRFVEMQKRDLTGFSTQEKHNLLLQPLTHKPVANYPIQYNLPSDIPNVIKEENYVVLSATSKRKGKDLPIKTVVELIEKFNRNNIKVVFAGVGQTALDYSQELERIDTKFINLVNKTSLHELGAVLKGSKALISIDTGTLHFGCSLKVPTVAVFFEDDHVPIWSPNPNLYNSVLVDKEQTAENIFNGFKRLIGEEV